MWTGLMNRPPRFTRNADASKTQGNRRTNGKVSFIRTDGYFSLPTVWVPGQLEQKKTHEII
jgi:hypothetical protein